MPDRSTFPATTTVQLAAFPRFLATSAQGDRRLLSQFLALAVACGGAESKAQAELRTALEGANPSKVAQAARALAPFEGQSATTDRLLAQAFLGPLARPDQAWPLLKAHPEPTDPLWTRDLAATALRLGPAYLLEASSLAPLPPLDPASPTVTWGIARAPLDPTLTWDALAAAAADCALFDSRPNRGRQPLDLPVSADLLPALRAAGAPHIVLGRARQRADPPPEAGRGPIPCETGLLLDPQQFPDPMPNHLIISLPLTDGPLHLDVLDRPEGPQIFAASDAARATRLLDTALRGKGQ